MKGGSALGGLCGDRGGCLQGDGEAELFELGDEAARSPLGVLAGGEVVVAEVLEHLGGAEQVPDQLDQGVGDGDGCLVRAAASRDLTILGAEVASFVRAAARADSISARRSHGLPLVVPTRRCLPADS